MHATSYLSTVGKALGSATGRPQSGGQGAAPGIKPAVASRKKRAVATDTAPGIKHAAQEIEQGPREAPETNPTRERDSSSSSKGTGTSA